MDVYLEMVFDPYVPPEGDGKSSLLKTTKGVIKKHTIFSRFELNNF